VRIQSGQIVSLGYGRYVRSDDVLAVLPITEERGPGRRALVWVRGVPDPIVASRSQEAIVEDLVTPQQAAAGASGLVRGEVRAARSSPRRGAGRRPAPKKRRTKRR
jgi:hypothetical protein